MGDLRSLNRTPHSRVAGPLSWYHVMIRCDLASRLHRLRLLILPAASYHSRVLVSRPWGSRAVAASKDWTLHHTPCSYRWLIRITWAKQRINVKPQKVTVHDLNDQPRSLATTLRCVRASAGDTRTPSPDTGLLLGAWDACKLPIAWSESYLAAKWGDSEGSARRRTLDTCLLEQQARNARTAMHSTKSGGCSHDLSLVGIKRNKNMFSYVW